MGKGIEIIDSINGFAEMPSIVEMPRFESEDWSSYFGFLGRPNICLRQ